MSGSIAEPRLKCSIRRNIDGNTDEIWLFFKSLHGSFGTRISESLIVSPGMWVLSLRNNLHVHHLNTAAYLLLNCNFTLYVSINKPKWSRNNFFKTWYLSLWNLKEENPTWILTMSKVWPKFNSYRLIYMAVSGNSNDLNAKTSFQIHFFWQIYT